MSKNASTAKARRRRSRSCGRIIYPFRYVTNEEVFQALLELEAEGEVIRIPHPGGEDTWMANPDRARIVNQPPQ